MKKVTALLMAVCLSVGMLAGCGTSTTTTTAAETTKATQAATTASAETTAVETTAAESHYPVTIDTYNYAKEHVEVTFAEAPTRVICTNQTQTEIMLYFGLDDAIAGVAYLDGGVRSDLAAQYQALVDAGKELTVTGYPDKETVLSLEPDFIFGWRSAFSEKALGDVSEWTAIGVNTMILRCSNNTAEDLSITSVLADIADIGKIFDIEDQTDAYIAEANAMLDEIAANVAALPADQSYTAILIEGMGEGSWYAWPVTCMSGSLLEAAGAKNIVLEGATLSVEDIINLNPDVIFVDYMGGQDGDETIPAAEAIAAITGETALAEVSAVKENRIMAINLTDIYGGGIRMVPSIEKMYNFMYGEHYPVTIDTYNYAKEHVEMTFTEAPTRVICTNQTQTEIMLYFGLDDAIAGVAYLDGGVRSDLAAQYQALVDAGKELTVTGYPDKETVLSLNPDFIFGWRSAFSEKALGDVSEWTAIGVNTMVLRCSNNTAEDLSITSVLADIADIGKIFNIEDKTNAYIAEAGAMLEAVQAKVSSLPEDEVYTAILIEGMGEGSWYAWPVTCMSGSLLEAAGAKNIVLEGATLSVEDIINLNPDVIFVDYMGGQDGDETVPAAEAIAAITGETALAEVSAVKENRIMAINLTDIYGGGIRMVPSIEKMFTFMYGE